MLTNSEIQELHRIYQTDSNHDRKERLCAAIVHINMCKSQCRGIKAILQDKLLSNKQKITKMFCYTSIICTPEGSIAK